MILASVLSHIKYRHVRLALSWLFLLTSIAFWIAFELKRIAVGEPPFIMRWSLVAVVYEGFNGISINTDD